MESGRLSTRTIYQEHYKMEQIVAELSVRTLQSVRDDNSFDLFWAAVLSKSQRLQIAPPQLPRHRKVLAKLEIESSAFEQVQWIVSKICFVINTMKL